jgi:hypothetical protein
LANLAADVLRKNQAGLTDPIHPIWLVVDDGKLKPHFNMIA